MELIKNDSDVMDVPKGFCSCNNGYVRYIKGEHTIVLDGRFTLDDLRKVIQAVEEMEKE